MVSDAPAAAFSRPDLSVIIPVLDEAAALSVLLPQLRCQSGLNLQVIVVDGGSQDQSIAIATAESAEVIASAKGRAHQLNRGAAIAAAEYCLFLHADSQIEDDDFLSAALACLRDRNGDGKAAGHFGLSFDRRSARNDRSFRYLEAKSRCGRRQTINGDQGLLITREFFDELGGFDEAMPFFEDQLIAERIFDVGRWVLLPGTLTTSGRRFETEGFHRRYILMSLIMGLYWSDVREFFPRARGVYREQSATDRLQLWPFFAAIWQMLIHDLGWFGSARAWLRVGRFVRGNSWQMFFWLDVMLHPLFGRESYPWTRFHDRVFQPLTTNAPADWLTTVLVFIWFMFCLGPYFYLVDVWLAKPGQRLG